MSLYDFKKCPVSIFKKIPVDFKIAQCRLSILSNGSVPCRYFINVPVDFKRVQCRLSNLRKSNVALSNLRVKGPQTANGSLQADQVNYTSSWLNDL